MDKAPDRVVFHVDCNGFYASVEEILFPELRQVPMAVCGNPESRRGVILAKNERAKAYGVKTAETVWQAKRKCPDLMLRPARHRLYDEYCEKTNAIYGEYTDQVERYGRDESYLDVTGSLRLYGGDAVKLAHEIRLRMPREVGLTVSVGVSFNKIFAKIASDLKKPNAVSVIGRDNFREVLWPMPASTLLMVGKATEQALAGIGIRTVGDLARAGRDRLVHKLGKHGEQLYLYANGLDESPVLRPQEQEGVQSIGNGRTFKRDLVSREDSQTALLALADTVASRLRAQGLKCESVQLTIKDPNFKVITRQKPVAPTWLAADIARESMELLKASWGEGRPIRMLTVTAGKLVAAEEAAEQLSLFDDPGREETQKKQERLEAAMDKIRDKYGSGSISAGSLLQNDLGINEDYGRLDKE